MNQTTELASDKPDGLFDRARMGDERAWQELFAACYPKVLRVVRRRLTSPAIRSLYDSTDFVGDVWKSLAEKPEAFDFPTIDALLAFLSRAAERKVVDAYRRRHTQKNDIDRERPIEGSSGPNSPEIASSDPTPSQIAQAGEAREWLFSGLSDEERLILEMRGEGYSNEEIAGRVGWHPRRVQRFLKDLGESWRARDDGGSP